MKTEDIINWLRERAKGLEPMDRFVLRQAANRLEFFVNKLNELEIIAHGQHIKGCESGESSGYELRKVEDLTSRNRTEEGGEESTVSSGMPRLRY